MAKLNCRNCLYANELSGGDVYCDKKELYNGVKIYIGNKEAELKCIAHSSVDFEETRADREWNHNSQADDICGVCNRRLVLHKEHTYELSTVETEDDMGNTKSTTIKKCSICGSKGR